MAITDWNLKSGKGKGNSGECWFCSRHDVREDIREVLVLRAGGDCRLSFPQIHDEIVRLYKCPLTVGALKYHVTNHERGLLDKLREAKK